MLERSVNVVEVYEDDDGYFNLVLDDGRSLVVYGDGLAIEVQGEAHILPWATILDILGFPPGAASA